MGRLLLLASRCLVAAALAGALLPGTVRGDDASDIPGVPLPGPVVTGLLGGPIYDVVYQLDVPPGHVILASLTGTPGTDFDLYLFDSTATTVLSNDGLLARSIGPTSDESLSYPSRDGGRYYLDLNGATDVIGTFTLIVQAVADGTPPAVSLHLEGGRRSVNRLDVLVEVSAADDLSGVVEMAVAADGATFGPWQPYARELRVTVPPGDGPKTVAVRVRNGVGLESAVASGTIRLDTVAPTVVAVAPAPGARVPGLRPVVAVRFDEAIDAASWEARGLIVQAGSGASVAGALRYDTATRTGLWVPLVDLAAGATYALTVGPVQDEAGNRIATGDSWTLTPLSPTVLGVVPARSVLRLGEGTSLAVRLEPAATGAVVAEARRADETAYAPLGSIELSAAGLAALEVSPAANTYYRFSYPGTATAASATGEIRVLVRRDVRLAGLDPSVTRRIRPGTTVSLTAEVAPRTGGVRLSFRLYRLDPATGRYRYAGSFGRVTNSDGRASLAWTPTRSGNYYWRVAVLPTVDYANNVSAVHRWRVTG